MDAECGRRTMWLRWLGDGLRMMMGVVLLAACDRLMDGPDVAARRCSPPPVIDWDVQNSLYIKGSIHWFESPGPAWVTHSHRRSQSR
jgi:hypothetical protein